MPNQGRVKVGIVGSQFEADIHAESFRMMPDEAEVVAVASPTPGHAERFAQRHHLPRFFTDYRQMLAEPDIEMITIAAPNALHAQMTVDAAQAGKHVVCEKPLCLTLEEADLMIGTCRREGVLLLYAEELFFTPKYVKAKQMADEGTFGKVYLVKQCEKHFGPHAPWFWDVNRSGGGMQDRIEVYGEGGVTYADLHMGNALPTYSEYGYGYAVEKAPTTKGWTHPVFEELWNYGFPQEMHHFARCVRGKDTPQATGEDGRVVQEALYAGYQSAGTGATVPLPFRPTGVKKPIDLWLQCRGTR